LVAYDLDSRSGNSQTEGRWMRFELEPELESFRQTVHDWVEREVPKDKALELESKEHEFPHELWSQMAAAGFHAIGIEERYGGAGGDVTTQVVLARELARSLAGLTWVWGISSFAGGKSVGLYGTEEQKERFLPGLAAGDLRFAIAITEPSGGTDVLGAMRTTAQAADGGWRLNGQKIWCTAANDADYLLLLARSDRDVPKRTQGLTLFLVPTDSDGLELRRIPKLGMKAISSCEVFLDDVLVPEDLVLGEPGRAWYQLLGTLNNERIVLAALALGILDGVLEEALRYLHEREVFGKPLGQMQIMQHYVADIAIWRKQAELLTFNAASLQSRGLPCGNESNMAKLVASERAVEAADRGIQMFGGMGYSLETHMQRYWRDARIYRIAPINNEMVRNTIAESYGLPRSF
jgi:acyl-CoA dehydrogenase